MSLAELIDLAEAHNPETRVAWENAIAEAAALGIARSELYHRRYRPWRSREWNGRRYTARPPVLHRHTDPTEEVSLDLNYTIFDYGARRGRIAAESARLLTANFGFNDVHRRLIFQVQETYYRLLNVSAQDTAARAESGQRGGGATSRRGAAAQRSGDSARRAGGAQCDPAQSQYDLQAFLGAEQSARGDLATALGAPAATMIRLQPLSEAPTPESIGETVEHAIDRALDQRPDLQAELADIRVAEAQRKEARAAYYPSLSFKSNVSAQSLYFQQQTLPWGHTADLTGGMALSLNWSVFDGGARRGRCVWRRQKPTFAGLSRRSMLRAIPPRTKSGPRISNLTTAFRQREAATALLDSATAVPRRRS